MATYRYKKHFFIRFIAYLLILTGLISLVLGIGPVTWAEFNYRKDQFFNVRHVLPPQVITSGQVEASSSASTATFGETVSSGEQLIKPVDTDYGLVIEKINANAKVIPNIDPTNEAQYTQALAKGVAEAAGSTKPGEPGNIFMFSHSTDAPWNIVRFNAIFYLLRELEKGDRISVFYQGRRYDYVVFDKTIVPGNDVSFLNNRYDKPVLTLQTCDPPGTILNRLIVRAMLVGS